MAPAIKFMRDVLGGNRTIRAAKQEYLPQAPAEKDARYASRLKGSVFANFTAKTRDGLVGMVLRENAILGEDVKPAVRALLENIDLCGSHWDVFFKQVFTDAVGEGHAFVLTDMQGALPEGSTLADEIRAGRRPYCVKYKADQANNWRWEQINGENVLTQVSLAEETSEPEGLYGEKTVKRQRVFRLPVLDYGTDEQGNQVRPAELGTVTWTLERKVEGLNGAEAVWVVDKSGTVSTSRIPLAAVYGCKKGEFISEPPLYDHGCLNVHHYQLSSSLSHVVYIANIPILVRKGAPETEVAKGAVVVSSDAAVDIGEEGDLFYCEHEGKATEACRRQVKDDEQHMSVMGLSIVAAKGDREITLGEKQMDQGERMSDLATMARSLQDCMESVLGFLAQYLGVADKNGDGGSVEVGVAEDLTLDPQDLQLAYQAVKEGLLTPDVFYTLGSKRWRVDLSTQLEELKKRQAEMPKPPQQTNGEDDQMPPQNAEMMQ